MVLKARACVSLIVEPEPRARERTASRVSATPRAEPVTVGVLTRRVLEETRPDAVIIASPSGLHFEQGALALSYGLPTFLEKPLACTAEHGRRLSSLGRGLLATSEQRIHRADLQLARSLIASGKLGEIESVEYSDMIFPAPSLSESWRNNPRLAGGGILLDLGYHTIGALQWLLEGESGVAVLSAELFYGRLAVESRARIRCSFGGVETFLDIGLTDHRPGEDLRVRGSRAELRIVRDRRDKLVSTLTLRGARRPQLRARIALDPVHDVRSLQDFMAGTSSTGQLARHVRTLEFLAAIYSKATKRFP